MPSAKSSKKPKVKPSSTLTFKAIGTDWWIAFYEKVSDKKLRELRLLIRKRIEDFDQTYSRFRKDSLVTKIAQKSGKTKFPTDSLQLFSFYEQLYKLTDGKVTPLVGQALEDAGYDASYSLKPKKIRQVPSWEEVMEYSHGVLTTKKPVTLDFGAAGKGYLVDIISELIEVKGIKTFCVDAGGDMHYKHPSEPLLVGLEHPDDPSMVIGKVLLKNESLCGSAGNRRTWANFHHILDPKALSPAKNVKATWVISSSTMIADGLATALFFTLPTKLAKHYSFAYVIVMDDNTVEFSSNLNGEIFVAKQEEGKEVAAN